MSPPQTNGHTGPHVKRKVLTASNPFEEPVTSLLVFGSQLLALSEDGGRLLIWDTHDGGEIIRVTPISIHLTCVSAFQSSIQFEPGFTAVSILHPATYLNKVLVASSQGSMQLWNIRTQFVPSRPPQIPILMLLQDLHPQVPRFKSPEWFCSLSFQPCNHMSRPVSCHRCGWDWIRIRRDLSL